MTVPPYGQPAPKPSSLPVVSLVFGVFGLIQCLPFVGGLVAIITGFIGRRKAKALSKGTGMATGGIVLGFIGLAISVILTVVIAMGGFAIFKVAETVSSQITVAEQLQKAAVAATSYGAANGGSFEGLTTANLESYGYIPSPEVSVVPFSLAGGSSYCIEGSQMPSGNNLIHIPIQTGDSSQFSININDRSFSYAGGGCPR